MKRYTKNEIKNVLDKVGVYEKDVVMVHSSLFSIGIMDSVPYPEQTKAVLQVLNNAVGSEGTIVVPTFNFDFCKGKLYSVKETPSVKMGNLSEYVRKHPAAIRSKHPMQSVAALGKYSELITKNDTQSAFEKGGSFDIMTNLNGKLLFLGANFQSAALIHGVEEKLHVPYRYKKLFSGSWMGINGKICRKTYSMFVRSEILKPILRLSVLENNLIEQGKLKSATLGMGKVSSVSFKDFLEAAEQMIKKDPFALLDNREEVIDKIENGIYNNVTSEG